MTPELVIFDMDGTLVNSSLTIANAINHVRVKLGFEPMSQAYILKRVNDHTLNPAQTFYHARKFEPHHEQWFSEYYTQHHAEELVLYEGILPLLDKLKSRGIKLAVATNAYRQSTLESLRHLGIYNHFDTIACYDDVTQGKPHPDMLHKILTTLACSASKAHFVGDGSRDEIASKRANIPYTMVDWGFSDYRNAVDSVETLESILLDP